MQTDADVALPILSTPPRARHARRGANPGLEKVELVEQILQASGPPLSRNQIRAELKAWHKDMSDPALNAVLGYLAADGKVIEGKDGLDWVQPAHGDALTTILRKRT